MFKLSIYGALNKIMSYLEVIIDSIDAMERAYTASVLISLLRWERTKGLSSGGPENRRAVRSGLQRNLDGFGSPGILHSPVDHAKA
jgi:hypothetical protein